MEDWRRLHNESFITCMFHKISLGWSH